MIQNAEDSLLIREAERIVAHQPQYFFEIGRMEERAHSEETRKELRMLYKRAYHRDEAYI